MSGALSEIASLLFSSSRSIKSASYSVIPDLAVSERHQDDLAITMHPVEIGAAITDHAFKQPALLEIQYGWSNSSLQALSSDFTGASIDQLLTGQLGEGYVKQVYQTMIALQKSRELCTVVTGKRLYSNMLIESVSTSTDSATAFSMFVTASLREILIVSTAGASVTSSVATSDQATPADTAATASTGTQQLATVSNQDLTSALWTTAQGQ